MPSGGTFVKAKMVTADALQVGGLTPLTTLDYPDHLACVIFTQGCPLACGYCHNPQLIGRAPLPDAPRWSAVREFLQRRQGLLEGVVFSGGEPTLQAASLPAIQEVADLGFKVALHTAGVYPQRLEALLPYLSWVGLDIKASPERYTQVVKRPNLATRVEQSLERLLESSLAFEVRITLHPLDFDVAHLESLLDHLASWSLAQVVLQPARPGQCLDPDYATIDQPFSSQALAAVIDRYQPCFEQLYLRA